MSVRFKDWPPGVGNHEIARRLGMSKKTVRNHVSQVLLKLQVPDRTAATFKAREVGRGRRGVVPVADSPREAFGHDLTGDGSTAWQKGSEANDVALLPRHLDSMPVVAPSDEGDCLFHRYSVDDSEAGQSCAGPSEATAAGDLDPFGERTVPGFTQDRPHLYLIARHPEVWPP
ncbi:MAG TPA: LuxR C-terminal-related transcriptional regulator [Jiangellaceae bacterium]|nr:LuxR C-terminal-related transcriptional regulator [Jiangellaceae bacterium]